MASRKRQVADKARRTCGDAEESREPGSSNRETSGHSRSKKLSRARKAGAASLSSPASTPVSSRREKEEETGSSKKTPKLLSKCKQWDINSPSRDGEQHHEIFWDPNSPTCFKLDNGKKKPASKCTVEISDIVNRIAPKDGTPTNSDASYFGVWIGDDAIPCTPVVTRTRTKLHRSRILKTEEELMALAKQLDRNLVEQKDQNDTDLMDNTRKAVNISSAQEDGDGSFLEYIPEKDEVSLALKSVSQSSGVGAEKNSHMSVDREAEEALNALFDCSTQKYSGQLSQASSHVSTSSIQEFVSDTENGTGKNQLLTKTKVPPESNNISGQFSFISKLKSDTLHYEKNSKQTMYSGKEPVRSSDMAHSESNSQDDFEDDWGDDILEDDSFVMQITQNPELIATPKSNMTSKTPRNANPDTVRGKDSSDCTAKVFTANNPNNFKFVPQKLNKGERSKIKTLDLNRTEVSNVKRPEESTRERTISSAHPVGPSGAAQVTKQNSTGPKFSTNPSSTLGVSKTYTFSSKPLSARKEKDEPSKKGAQAVQETRAVSKNKESVLADEWDDPKFSDEVLDMFCESDSLWEEKDNDDDLLYQVCDDVERLSQVQASDGNTQFPTSSHNVFTKSATNNKAEPHNTTNYSYTSNKSSGYALCSNKVAAKGVSPASMSGNCSNSFQNSSFQRTNHTSAAFSRSNSMPSVADSTKFHEPHSKSVINLQANATNARTSHAPSKYSFTKNKPFPALSVHTNGSLGNESTSRGHQSYDDSNRKNPCLQLHLLPSQQSTLKRHVSESTIQSSKVFASEDRSKKCSMEEIERKKQEALARRKLRGRVCSNDSAPT